MSSRLLALRTAMRAATQHHVRVSGARSYSSTNAIPTTSNTPWLIGSAVSTVGGLALILSSGQKAPKQTVKHMVQDTAAEAHTATTTHATEEPQVESEPPKDQSRPNPMEDVEGAAVAMKDMSTNNSAPTETTASDASESGQDASIKAKGFKGVPSAVEPEEQQQSEVTSDTVTQVVNSGKQQTLEGVNTAVQ